MKYEYMILEWGQPSELPFEEREYCFIREGKPCKEFEGMDRRQLETVFNRLGAEGWELVQVYEYRKFYLKRHV